MSPGPRQGVQSGNSNPTDFPMTPSPWLSPEQAIRQYFHAKDENRPRLMAQAFTENATLHMHLRTGSISFPAVSSGRSAITDVLVRNFGKTYENVYTFALERPPVARTAEFSCDWLVVMTEKESGNLRVGCGRYDWWFDAEGSGLATRLDITIDSMQTLPPDQATAVFGWMDTLGYPWTSAAAVTVAPPPVDELAPVLTRLGQALRTP